MNDGVNITPEQAARSLRIVRLVSFGASAALAVVLLAAIASLRYAPVWPQPDPPPVALVSEVQRPPPPPRPTPPRPPNTPQRAAEPQDQAPALPPAPPVRSEPVTITDPVWIERPRNPERFYPREAFIAGVAGEVVLECEVDVAGRLRCTVASETPAGRGFGEAALRIANAHVMRPAMRNGAPARGRYRMVVPFSPGD
jgi:periplasmic protein TonB